MQNKVKRGTRAVVLLSGGLDSATVLAIAARDGHECYALSFQYGQRHVIELNAARRVAEAAAVQEHRIFPIELSVFGGSALTDSSIEIPQRSTHGIPVTYVPARNTVFLAVALGWAEVIGARDIYIGVNAVDYSGYPDCRPEFIAAFETMANLGTKAGVEGDPMRIRTPLIKLSKAHIIRQGLKLGVDYSLTISCYAADGEGHACGNCDSCRLRAKGFAEAKMADPTCYTHDE
ncbi:MAG: 7-cyano-7-deazaguanine synthase QueC [Gammaproteobacteria bacterium]|nr:7-cyano-7-deazaguanine synthase QueC [Gammaproteobacteria bacterium]